MLHLILLNGLQNFRIMILELGFLLERLEKKEFTSIKTQIGGIFNLTGIIQW